MNMKLDFALMFLMILCLPVHAYAEELCAISEQDGYVFIECVDLDTDETRETVFRVRDFADSGSESSSSGSSEIEILLAKLSTDNPIIATGAAIAEVVLKVEKFLKSWW